MIRRLIILLLIVGCGSNSKGKNDNITNDDKNIMVRVINKRSDSTKTVIGSTDYGIIASRDTSVYKSVAAGNNDIYLNDEYFRQHQFMINQPSSKIYSTYTIRKSAHVTFQAEQQKHPYFHQPLNFRKKTFARECLNRQNRRC